MDGYIILSEGKNLKRFEEKLQQLENRSNELTPYVNEFVENMRKRLDDNAWNPTLKQWNFLSIAWLDLVNQR